MAKRPKRKIVKKNKVVKKVVKNTGRTPEQQARENEMLKTMLSRQQPVIAGQTQQHDKMQQQLDTYNKAYNQQLKENETLSRQIRELKDKIEIGKNEREQIMSEVKHQNKLVKQEEKNLKAKEDAEKRKDELNDKLDELHDEQRKYDDKTLEGEHHKQMTEYDENIREKRRNIEEKEDEIKQNKLYAELNSKKDELATEEAKIRALVQIINSDEFKNPHEALVEVNKNLYLERYKTKQTEDMLNKKIELQNINAERKGQEAYLAELTKGSPIHVLNKDGTKKMNPHGGWVYEKNPDGTLKIDPNSTILGKYEKVLAEQIKQKQESEIKLADVSGKVQNATNLIKESNKAIIDAENTERELRQIAKVYESEQFKNKMDLVTKQQQLVAAKEAQNESTKRALQMKKKLVEMEARQTVLSNYDPSNSNPDAVQAQMGTYVDQITGLWNDNIKKQEAEIENGKRRDALYESIDKVLDRYDPQNREVANTNLIGLIEMKTDSKLRSNMDEWDPANMNKGIEFINMIGRFDPNLLLNGEDLDAFVKGQEFNNFKWDITGK